MGGSREHIYGCYFFYGIILFGEEFEIACHGGRVTADVDDSVGGHLHDGVDQLGGEPLARRIDYDHIGCNTLQAQFCRGGSRVTAEKACIMYAVLRRVAFGVSTPISSLHLSAMLSPIVPAPQ